METIGRDLREMQRTPLAHAHVTALRLAGEMRTYSAGAIVSQPGDPADRFIYLETGEIEVVNPFTRDRLLPATLGPTQFVGEISFLDGGNWSMLLRAVCETRVTEVSRDRMLALMSDIPEMSDIVITVFAARRRRQLEAGEGSLILLGEEADRQVRSIGEFLSRNKIPHSSVPLHGEEAKELGSNCGVSPDRPAVIFGGTPVDDPSLEQIARLLGLNRELVEDEEFDVLIVGGGPAGVAAGVYAGAEGLSALVIEDTAIGGQAGTSSRIENYMGFPTGISGADLVWRGEVQAMKFGTRFAMPRRVTRLDRLEDGYFCANFDGGQRVRGRSVVVATGVQYRRLPIEGLSRFEGAGAYYAATESEARYCRDGEIVVIGGGNSAGQAAMFLSRTARHVRVLVRGRSLAASMSSYLSSRLEAHPSITVEYETQVVALDGDAKLETVTTRSTKDGEERLRPVCAAFIMVGAAPNTGWLSDLVRLDDHGFILTGAEAHPQATQYETSCPGIYAVGDVRSRSVKRVASSVGEGSVVISSVWNHVNASKD